jgi:hypothetical protein
MLLFEEFYRKVLGLGKGNFILRLTIKVTFIGLFLFFAGLFVYSVVSRNNKLLIIILGIFVIAEVSHFIRKYREKEITKQLQKINDDKF